MNSRNLGRNDPCWCGSSKKYKHCHLNQDEQAARATITPPAQTNELAREPSPHEQSLPAETVPAPSAEDDLAQAEWDNFREADLDGKVAFFRKRLDEKRLDGEEAFEMLLAIRDDSHPRHNPAARAQFKTLADQLEAAMPQVYSAEYPFILECLLKDAIADQAWDRVNTLAAQFAQIAADKTEEFFGVLDALLYHGQTSTLLEEMKLAWDRVSDDPDITPSGVNDFFEVILDLNLFQYLETTPQPRADDPALVESIRAIGNYNPVWLELAVARLAAPAPSAWQRADFGNDVDAETWAQNVAALLYEFMAELKRAGIGNAGVSVPYTRSNMAHRWLHQILRQQSIETALAARPKGKRAAAHIPSSPLIPQYKLLDRILAGKFDLFGSEPYPVGALMELGPAYLNFLARRSVIHPTEMDRALDDLAPLIKPLVKVLDSYGADMHLLENMQHAWSDETLDTLRNDPALAQARTQPLLLPPSPNPLANAQLYRFQVEYKQADDVWFILELRRDQTLEDLHLAIQDAADFDNDHLYSFYLSGTAWDKETEYSTREARYSSDTALKNVPLRMKQHFLYLFDFGDQHEFDVQLIDAQPDAPAQAYPHLVAQHGKLPPQYGEDEDEEDEDGDEGEFETDEDWNDDND
ncbi:MAG: SEC-C domain-containing protein [Chloroflexi bacterium]|nr:SEC-C domain-containing protein [Chloroflexota bacterium]